MNQHHEPLLNAIYRPSKIKEYRDNPLIEALPPFCEAPITLKRFGRFPRVSEADRKLPPAERMQSVGSLDEYLEPMPFHLDIIEQVGLLIRSGYKHRNPLSAAYRKALNESYRRAMDGVICTIGEEGPAAASSIALFGVSGMGKSTTIERALCFYPNVLHHQTHGFIQVCHMKLDCPTDGGLKPFLKAFVAKIDNLTQSNYQAEYGTRATTEDLIRAVARLSSVHHLGLLVVDEVQHLLSAKDVSNHVLLRFLMGLSNQVKVPVVYIGTPKALDLLKRGSFRMVRRAGDKGCFIWDRFYNDNKRKAGLERKEEWLHFLGGLWTFQWMEKFTKLTTELADVMYFQSQGIIAIAVRLFQLSQLLAIREGSECITPELLNRAANEYFSALQPVLNHLRNPSHHKASDGERWQYEDLLRDGLSQVERTVHKQAEIIGFRERDRTQTAADASEIYRAVSSLIGLSVEEHVATQKVEELFRSGKAHTSGVAVHLVLSELFGEKGPKGAPAISTPTLAEITSLSKAPSQEHVQSTLETAGLVDAEIES